MVQVRPLPRRFFLGFGLEHGAPLLGEDPARFHLSLNSQDELSIFPDGLICYPGAVFGRCEETSLLHWYVCRALEELLECRPELGSQVRLLAVDKGYSRQRRSDS
jgi:hypothetical protein